MALRPRHTPALPFVVGTARESTAGRSSSADAHEGGGQARTSRTPTVRFDVFRQICRWTADMKVEGLPDKATFVFRVVGAVTSETADVKVPSSPAGTPRRPRPG